MFGVRDRLHRKEGVYRGTAAPNLLLVWQLVEGWSLLDEMVVHFLLVRCGVHICTIYRRVWQVAHSEHHTDILVRQPGFASSLCLCLAAACTAVGIEDPRHRPYSTHARSSAHSNNLSHSRTRQPRVRECDISFASSGVFGIARAGSCSGKFCRWRGVPGKTGVMGGGFWRSGKFWRCRCRCRGAVGMQQRQNANSTGKFGVLAFWRGAVEML
jgi:hypothetical protein